MLGPRDYNTIQYIRLRDGLKPLIKRSIACLLAGRFTYSIETPEQYERNEILQLESNNSFPCQIIKSSNDILPTPLWRHWNYIEILANTIFVPCPAGKNKIIL